VESTDKSNYVWIVDGIGYYSVFGGILPDGLVTGKSTGLEITA